MEVEAIPSMIILLVMLTAQAQAPLNTQHLQQGLLVLNWGLMPLHLLFKIILLQVLPSAPAAVQPQLMVCSQAYM
jgi:hypothetical protein